ncbi:MAG: hypothetical protein GX589_06480 [Deltaproteobacteria bacterium]|nr:hypothetical protein [Deltaproteobacteria bacterium]
MLVFDFDGVLIDSVEETLVSAFNAATASLVVRVEDAGKNFVQLFRRNRFVARSAGEMVLLAHWCLEQAEGSPVAVIDREAFVAWMQQAKETSLDCERKLFEARTRLAEAHTAKWLALSKPYQPIFGFIKRCDNLETVILTRKDKRAVLEIGKHYGLELKRENVYAGDGGVGKIENLEAIFKRFTADKITFVDDSITNLLELRQHRDAATLELLHANWGYVGEGDIKLAADAGIRSLSQEELQEVIKRHHYIC